MIFFKKNLFIYYSITFFFFTFPAACVVCLAAATFTNAGGVENRTALLQLGGSSVDDVRCCASPTVGTNGFIFGCCFECGSAQRLSISCL